MTWEVSASIVALLFLAVFAGPVIAAVVIDLASGWRRNGGNQEQKD